MTQDVERHAPPGPTIAPAPVPYPVYPCWPLPEEKEIALSDLLRVLWKRRWLIALVTVLGTGAAVVYALLATPVYRAQAVIAPPEQKKSGAASAALAVLGGMGPEIAGSLGLAVGGNDANRLEAILKSHRLLARVVSKHKLLPVALPDRWDVAKNAWRTDGSGETPNVWDAEKALRKLYGVKNDSRAGVLVLTMESRQIETARKVLECFLQELAYMIQEDELKRIELSRAFVEAELRRTSDPVVVAKLQVLLSEQVEKAMMARNVEHFAFEVIDPPDGSDKKVKPQRALLAALGLASSLLAGVALAFLVERAKNARTSAT